MISESPGRGLRQELDFQVGAGSDGRAGDGPRVAGLSGAVNVDPDQEPAVAALEVHAVGDLDAEVKIALVHTGHSAGDKARYPTDAAAPRHLSSGASDLIGLDSDVLWDFRAEVACHVVVPDKECRNKRREVVGRNRRVKAQDFPSGSNLARITYMRT